MSILSRLREQRRAAAADEATRAQEAARIAELTAEAAEFDRLVQRFFEADGGDAKRAALEPVMLTERFDILFGHYIRANWFGGADEAFVRTLEQDRMVLRYVASDAVESIDDAWADLFATPPAALAAKVSRLHEISGQPETRSDADLVDEAVALADAIAADPWFSNACLFLRCSVLREGGVCRGYRWRLRHDDPADLDRSLDAIDRVLEIAPPGWPWLPGELTNGAQALLERYDRDHELRDIELAIHAAEDAITRALPNELDMGIYHGTWARALQAMAREVDDGMYWAAAADAYGQAAANLPESAYRRRGYLDDLAVCLVQAQRTPSRRTRPPGILAGNQVELSRMMANDPELASRITIVPKNSLQIEDNEMPRGIDDAIELQRSSRASYEPGTHSWIVSTGNLAATLLLRASNGGGTAIEDEDTARELAAELLAHPAVAGDARMGAHSHMAEVGRLRWRRDADATKVGETTQAYQAAVDIAEDLIDGRGIDIARQWGDWAAAREAWREAAGAYDAALRLQQLLVAREPVARVCAAAPVNRHHVGARGGTGLLPCRRRGPRRAGDRRRASAAHVGVAAADVDRRRSAAGERRRRARRALRGRSREARRAGSRAGVR